MDQNASAQRARKARSMLTYEETKQELLKLYEPQLNGSVKRVTALRCKEFKWLKDAVLYHTQFLTFDGCSIPTRVHYIINNKTSIQTCRICGAPVKRNVVTLLSPDLATCGQLSCRVASMADTNKNKPSEEKALIQAKKDATCLERYGVKTKFLEPGFQEIAHKSKVEKYGENYKQLEIEKARKTVNSRTLEEKQRIKDKSRATMLKNHGVEYYMQLPQNKYIFRDAVRNIYNVDNIMDIPEYRDKIKDSWLNKSEEELSKIQSRREQTCLDLYGVTNGGATEESNRKKSEAYAALTDEQKQARKQQRQDTFVERFGGYFSESIRAKSEQTCLLKYGTAYPPHDPTTRRSQYFYKDSYFDSSYELLFFIAREITGNPVTRNTNKFSYFVDEKEHFYYPDFIDKDNNYIEIKGAHFFDKEGHLINPFTEDINIQIEFRLKGELMEHLGVQVIKDIEPYRTIVDETFGKNYVDQFRVVKS